MKSRGEREVLKVSKIQLLPYVLAALAAIGLLIWYYPRMEDQLYGMFLLIVAGASLLFQMNLLLFSKRYDLILNEEGFEYGTLFKRFKYTWNEISNFEVFENSESKQLVTYTFDPNFHDDLKIKRFGAETHDGVLPQIFGISAEQLVWKLNSKLNPENQNETYPIPGRRPSRTPSYRRESNI